jgi:hypothetical protein
MNAKIGKTETLHETPRLLRIVNERQSRSSLRDDSLKITLQQAAGNLPRKEF